jgi:hypothetical protein
MWNIIRTIIREQGILGTGSKPLFVIPARNPLSVNGHGPRKTDTNEVILKLSLNSGRVFNKVLQTKGFSSIPAIPFRSLAADLGKD